MLRAGMAVRLRAPVNSTLGCMTEPTAGDLYKLREELEVRVARALGDIILRMSRLDTNLSLMISSIHQIQGKAVSDESLFESSLHGRLKILRKFVHGATEFSPHVRKAMLSWLREVDEARSWRNQLIHGRWDIDPRRRVLLNLTGLGEVRERRAYTMEELDAFIETLERLNSELSRMRRQWQLP